MNIELVLFTDYLIPEDGKYLVRTTTSFGSVNYIGARCTRVWNEKRQRFETSVDVSNQIVSHISTEKL